MNDDQREKLRAGDGIDPYVQEAIRDTREDTADRASMTDRNPRMAVALRFLGVFEPGLSQSTKASSLTPVTHSNNIRDYYSRLSTLLDRSAFVNDIIHRRIQDPNFMECFDVDPRTVSLGELFANKDDADTDDDDYEDPIMDVDNLYAFNSADQSLPEYEKNGTWSEVMSVNERIDIIHLAAETLQDYKYTDLRRELDNAAARLVTSEEGSAGRGFVREHNQRGRATA